MRNDRMSSRKLKYLFSLVCMILVSNVSLRTTNTEAAANKSTKFTLQSKVAASRGRYNGKIVFTSDRQGDG